MIGYALKRISRSKLLFLMLFGGVFISSATFATITLGTNALFLGMVDSALEDAPFDMEVSSFLYRQYPSELRHLRNELGQLDGVIHSEIITRVQNRIFWGPNIASSEWEVYTGIEDRSQAYDGITILSGNSTLGPNDVWVVNSSTRRPEFNIGDEFNLTFTVHVWHPNEELCYDYPRNLTLRVAGFVTVTDFALRVLVREAEEWKETPNRNLYITNWDLTFAPDIHVTYALVLGYPLPHAYEHSILVLLDRPAIINPIDIQGSFIRLTMVEGEVEEIADVPNTFVFNLLKENIDIITEESLNLAVQFLTSSIPIFFIALYLGVTMSDVTFNVRRREIGLLVTKGARRQTVLRIFLTETLIIGTIAGALSIGIAILLLPTILGPLTILRPLSDFSILIMAGIMMFACLIALISIYTAASHVTKIPTIEALREYSPTTHPTEYNKTVVWIALLAGSFKIVMWLTGINPVSIIYEVGYPSLVMLILLSTWLIFDLAVNPIALLLFLYGISKLLIQGSQIIYQASERLMRWVLGGIGVIASRSIKRSPARTAAIVFILALVIGYGFQTLTVLASEQEYIYRSHYADVGSDISASLISPHSASLLIPVVEEIPGVRAVSAEFWTYITIGPVWNIGIRAINATRWSQTAYYEEQWFSSVSSEQALTALQTNNHTIIVQKQVASQKELLIGDTMDVWRNPNTVLSLIVGGYFGPAEFPESETISPRGDYSLVSVEFLKDLDIFESSTCRLLIRTAPDAQVEEIMQEVESSPYVSTIESLETRLVKYLGNPILSAPGNILRIEIFFSFILASFGTSIIIGASLKEKEWELALMAARGSSKRQTRILLVGETALWIMFALIIGGFTGLVATYAQLNGLVALDAFTPRNTSILLSPLLIGQFVGFVLLLIIFALIPVFQATRRAQRGAEVLR